MIASGHGSQRTDDAEPGNEEQQDERVLEGEHPAGRYARPTSVEPDLRSPIISFPVIARPAKSAVATRLSDPPPLRAKV